LSLYNDILKIEPEKFYTDHIKKISKSEFKSLRPYFDENEIYDFQNFLIEKKNKQSSFKKSNFSNIKKNNNEPETIELDDEVIIDPNFAIILNENREIIVEGKVYKYQENGVFILSEENIDEFRNYINGDELLNNTYNDNDFGFQEMDYLTRIYYDENQSNTGGGNEIVQTVPNLLEAKLNFQTYEFSRNPSLWGETFGYTRSEIITVPDDKRAKLKFWNRNYLLFKSIGTEIRFQKKVKFLGIIGWQKSYPTKIAMGINSLQYNYSKGAGNFFNSNIFAKRLYSLGGYDYFANGQFSYTRPPIVPFPLANVLGINNGLKVSITFPFTDFKVSVNLTPKQYANLINQAGSLLLKEGLDFAKSLSIFGFTSVNTPVLINKFYRDVTSITIINKNWIKDEDNNITQYFDIQIPTITIRADIGISGQNFFSNPTIPFPSLTSSNYKTGSIDFYGGVLYKGVWYGKRMVSNDFNR